MGKNTAESLVAELEKLQSKVQIYRVSAEDENLHMLETYVAEHNKITKKEVGADQDAAGNFNEYLQKKLKDDPIYAGKIIVAEITGDIGLNPQYRDIDDEYDEAYDQDIKISLEGADLSGSRLVQVSIFKSLQNVTLRDCLFEDVFFNGCQLSNVDLRGTKLKNCEFQGYNMEDGIEGGDLQSIQFDLANAESAEMLGLFRIEEYTMERHREDERIKRDTNDECEEKIVRFKKQKAAEQGWSSWATSFAYTTEEQKKFNVEIEKVVEEIKKEFEAIQAKRLRVNANQYIIPLPAAQYDPTYIPGDAIKARVKKISLKATAQDLEEYSRIRPSKKSFNDFVASKPENQKTINQAKQANPEKQIIPVADFFFENKKYETIRGLDLSDLNLKGVNFSRVTFSKCKFDRSDLTGSCFEGAVLKDLTSFKNSILTDTNFIGATGHNVNFAGALMPRARMMYGEFYSCVFEGALLYSADLTGSNIEKSILRDADMRCADLEKVNMRYVDAQYVKMQQARLIDAILDGADFSHANLSWAVMTNVSAQLTNFTSAALEDALLQHSKLQGAILKEIKAKGVNLTGADMKNVQAQLADLSGAIMDEVDAKFANFTEAILRDAHARQADFSSATMEKLKGERLDISDSILTETKLRNANLTQAIIQRVKAYKADFRDSILKGMDAQNADLKVCDLSGAKAQSMDVRGAHLIMSHMEKTQCTGMKFDADTLLLDANFRDAIGAEPLRELQKEQHRLNPQLFGRTKYGACKNNDDGSNDRFKCQRIGAAILSSALGGATGCVMAGPFVGMGGMVAAGLVSDRALVAIKAGYFHEQGYISNQLGDKLAELGALAIATGAGSLEGGIYSAPAAIALSVATGLMSPGNLTLVTGGVMSVSAGIQGIYYGLAEQTIIGKVGGVISGTLSTVSGFISIPNYTRFTYSILLGAGSGSIGAAVFAYNQLQSFDEDKKTGMRPEDIYKLSIQKLNDSYQKIWPTWNKFVCAAVYMVLGMAVAALICTPISIFAGLHVAASLAVITSAVITVGAVGLVCGYLFDTNLSFWQFPMVQDIQNYFFQPKTNEIMGGVALKQEVSSELPLVDVKSHVVAVEKTEGILVQDQSTSNPPVLRVLDKAPAPISRDEVEAEDDIHGDRKVSVVSPPIQAIINKGRQGSKVVERGSDVQHLI
jgi:uncharacterized protein YjbI with pentapeptide repeats